MVDTQVLSFSLSTEPSTKGTVLWRQQRDSAALVQSFSEVRVSAIVVFEMLRGPPAVVRKIRSSGILDVLAVEPLDAAISLAAADLLEVARSKVGTCVRCLNVSGATKCPKCGQLVSHQQKAHDALIVATAATLADVDTLYSYDPGVRELSAFVKTIKVLEPPNLDGPLFSKVT